MTHCEYPTFIHLIGAVNKFCFGKKISKLSEENYQKLVAASFPIV